MNELYITTDSKKKASKIFFKEIFTPFIVVFSNRLQWMLSRLISRIFEKSSAFYSHYYYGVESFLPFLPLLIEVVFAADISTRDTWRPLCRTNAFTVTYNDVVDLFWQGLSRKLRAFEMN